MPSLLCIHLKKNTKKSLTLTNYSTVHFISVTVTVLMNIKHGFIIVKVKKSGFNQTTVNLWLTITIMS